jgi:adenine-specific DNA-methyltransferase
MARLEDLITNVEDTALRTALAHEVRTLKQRMPFGLVFERHLPENVVLPSSAGVRTGDQVRFRDVGEDQGELRVLRRSGDRVAYVDEAGDEHEADVEDLFVVKTFGESVYPTLTPLGSVERGGDRPYHAVVNGENYHSLQLLLHCWEDGVDCIYIDPPYNTGARDWKYNNRYVDDNDTWRHSKWLSFMEKRLKLAKRLLKSDGVLIVTIDEHEVHHLGVLLEALFPDARRQMVTIVNNAAGVSQGGFYRVEEYAFFCFLGSARPVPGADDLLGDEATTAAPPMWFSLNRYGGSNSVPARRPGLVYPIAIDPDKRRVVGVGKTLKERQDEGQQLGDLSKWRPDPDETVDGLPVVWPFRADGTLSTWQVKPDTLVAWAAAGFIRVREQANGSGGNRFSVSYVRSGNQKKVLEGAIPIVGRESEDGAYVFGAPERHLPAKTVWKRARHDAGKWGSRVLKAFVPNVSFDYPKSPYAVLDSLAAVVGDRPNAVVCDFFAGSGTTLHATLMLNRQDGGQRQCVLVTNNEVEAGRAAALKREGLAVGDPDYERHGIFEAVARPRVEAALTGRSADGAPIEGAYLDGRPYAEGFDENCEFFRLDYLDPDEVELGRAFAAVHPLLWLIAGARAKRADVDPEQQWAIVADAGYAVLFEALAVRDFIAALNETDGIEHLFVVTDSEDAYAETAEAVGPGYTTQMLYRDYLRSFRIQAMGSS